MNKTSLIWRPWQQYCKWSKLEVGAVHKAYLSCLTTTESRNISCPFDFGMIQVFSLLVTVLTISYSWTEYSLYQRCLWPHYMNSSPKASIMAPEELQPHSQAQPPTNHTGWPWNEDTETLTLNSLFFHSKCFSCLNLQAAIWFILRVLQFSPKNLQIWFSNTL